MKRYFLHLLLFLFLFNCNPTKESSDWCDQPLRAQFADLEEIRTDSDWFKVYDVGADVYAIAEPYNFQEVISYLILGTEQAILFDTGMGMSSIAAVIKELTSLPITVINSHTHYDHIGGNHEFDRILAMNTTYTRKRAENGMEHSIVASEVTHEALCDKHLQGFDKATYHIKPFQITDYVEDGSTIDIGNRLITVLSVPGHTIDSIVLLDRENGYLWTGDTFYEAPIWLFDEGTDLEVYRKSIGKLEKLAGELTTLFPAHNTPVAAPERLKELTTAFDMVMQGKVEQTNPESESTALFEFEHFSFMIRKDLLPK